MNELHSNQVITRRSHQCEWCEQIINTGDKAQSRAYIFDGEFTFGWQHPECFGAMEKSDSVLLVEGWSPGECERGVPLE